VKRLKLVISDEAIADLIDLWTYIAEDNPERADPFVDQIHEKARSWPRPR
jgi:plasmid stabilization system protein ParE